MSLSHVEVLFFDVCGTVCDWQSTLTSELKSSIKAAPHPDPSAQARLLKHDWPTFARQWHDARRKQLDDPSTTTLRSDDVSRSVLDSLISSVPDLAAAWTEPDPSFFIMNNLALIWHQLHPFPDSRAGLQELRRQFKVGTLTRGEGIALNVDLAKWADLGWDFVIDSEVLDCGAEGKGEEEEEGGYLVRAMEVLGIDDPKGQGARRGAMVSSRLSDLRRAKRLGGMSTVWVRRESEGEEEHDDDDDDDDDKLDFVDVVVDGLEELASVAGGLPMA